MTTNQYNARHTQLTNLLASVQNELAQFDSGQRTDVSNWNLHHDIETSTEKAIEDLEYAFMFRKKV